MMHAFINELINSSMTIIFQSFQVGRKLKLIKKIMNIINFFPCAKYVPRRAITKE